MHDLLSSSATPINVQTNGGPQNVSVVGETFPLCDYQQYRQCPHKAIWFNSWESSYTNGEGAGSLVLLWLSF